MLEKKKKIFLSGKKKNATIKGCKKISTRFFSFKKEDKSRGVTITEEVNIYYLF